MKNNILLIVNAKDDMNDYRKVGINTFLFPLEGYSIGYNAYFNKDEIEEDGYLLINCLLSCSMVEELRLLLPSIKCKGIVYEDIAVYNLVKELDLDMELIFFQNHFATNYSSINYWLNKGVDSLVVSNEITKDEINDILNNSISPLVVHLLGYNQAMYSRRTLLSNYQDNFNFDNCREGTLKEVSSRYSFKVLENDLGTVLYNDSIYYGKDLLDMSNIKYYLVNGTFLSTSEVLDILDNKIECSDGFLNKETIFKLKGGNL